MKDERAQLTRTRSEDLNRCRVRCSSEHLAARRERNYRIHKHRLDFPAAVMICDEAICWI